VSDVVHSTRFYQWNDTGERRSRTDLMEHRFAPNARGARPAGREGTQFSGLALAQTESCLVRGAQSQTINNALESLDGYIVSGLWEL